MCGDILCLEYRRSLERGDGGWDGRGLGGGLGVCDGGGGGGLISGLVD